ncbi:MAG: MBL fold metallo-hydrolase [bacterium]
MRYWLYAFLGLSVITIFFGILIGVFGPSTAVDVYFCDVGQGDGALVVLPGNVKIVVDGGVDERMVSCLTRYLPIHDRVIDLVIISHPEKDHYAGLISVLNQYRVRTLLYNGRDGQGDYWDEFEHQLEVNNVQKIAVSAGDTVQYADYTLKFLWPFSTNNESNNDDSLILMFEGQGIKTLFTGDIGFASENVITDMYDVTIDVLKVSHHGSVYATGTYFLHEAKPYVSIISVGENSYGHPHPSLIQRLQSSGSEVYRTDIDGDVHLVYKGGILEAFSQK